jgi:hypothetical protein
MESIGAAPRVIRMIPYSTELPASLPASPTVAGRSTAIRRLCVLVGVGVPESSPVSIRRGLERQVPAGPPRPLPAPAEA